MYDFIIVSDSTADLNEEYVNKTGLPIFHLTYTIEGKSYGSNEELDPKVFYKMMRDGSMPITSQVNPDEAKAGIMELLKINKNVLYLAFSSGLSGTYNSVRLAAEEINEEVEGANVIVCDTLAASMGEGLIVYKAIKLREEGKTIEEVAKWVEEYKLNSVHMFTVDDLNHLYRGGRVSRGTAFIGTVLSIKPVLHVDDEGHLIPISKERGRKKSLLALVDLMEERMGRFKDENNDMIMISHGDCEEDALFVKEEVEKRFGFTNFMINCIGPTIGTHAGPGTVALFFMGENR